LKREREFGRVVNLMATATLRIPANRLRGWVAGLWARILRLSRRAPKRLRLCESLPLGERRFVAVVEFDAARFLVGGTASSLVLLSRLADVGDREIGDQAVGDRDVGDRAESDTGETEDAPPGAAAAAGKLESEIC
jgi:hypothetical protein